MAVAKSPPRSTMAAGAGEPAFTGALAEDAVMPAEDGGTAVPSLPDAWAEFLLAEGFQRLDCGERPAQVSAAVWDAVFPPDRAQVLTAAGRLFLAGHDPNDAVRTAVQRLDQQRWTTGGAARRLAALAPLLCDDAPLPPPPHLAAACDAVAWTARRSGAAILASQNPARAVFLCRAWRAPPGLCLVCGKPAGDAVRLWGRMAEQPGGDAIHTAGCQDKMRQIGPLFAALVIEEIQRLRAAAPAVLPTEERVYSPDLGEVGEDADPLSGLAPADARLAR